LDLVQIRIGLDLNDRKMCVFQDKDMDEDILKSFRPPNNTQWTRLYGRLVLGRREAAVGSGSGCRPPRVRLRIAIGCDLSASGLPAVANLQGSDARESTCSKAVTDAPDEQYYNLGSQAACEASLYLTHIR
jgi:hypothetical protein